MPGKQEQNRELEIVRPLARKGKDMTKTHAFVIILKYYYDLHEDVTMVDILKMQILNKRCYDTLVPMAMSQLKLYPEPAPCALRTLESDIQDQVTAKKASGVSLQKASFITIQVDANPRNFVQASRSI